VEELVELDSLRGSLVGIPGKTGLSVEQRKRLTIAVELVANPSIVFMDVSPSPSAELFTALHPCRQLC
jgi:ABC-type multidrug transport system ATPase subunit